MIGGVTFFDHVGGGLSAGLTVRHVRTWSEEREDDAFGTAYVLRSPKGRILLSFVIDDHGKRTDGATDVGEERGEKLISRLLA